ncbi:TPA: thrombospondin type 3 repeat-containing protein [Candidatus Gracilibacteria bacterium]|nr:thrombospondin type 3 repeat-containing protein [Candidatus Gracilibacteria bacterium]
MFIQTKKSLLTILLLSVSVSVLTVQAVFAEETKGDLYFIENSLSTSPNSPLVHQKTRLYLQVGNTSNSDMKGVVRAFDVTESKRVEVEQTFTTVEGRNADLYWDFTPKSAGVHEVAFRIIPWESEKESNADNNKIIRKIFVDSDFDKDGIGDQEDKDDDNDGVNDVDDEFPYNRKESRDFDKDGIGDNADLDDDNDGILDTEDQFPNDAAESLDTDGDGIGDNIDEDDDNDGVLDEQEIRNGTDPLKADSDGDGVDDGADSYPTDSRYTKDTDSDGIPNAEDTDDDSDGVLDTEDKFPEDKNEWSDADEDGLGDFADEDDDNDGLLDVREQEIGTNPLDSDTDDDGVGDAEDVFPLDKNEWLDSDGDGLGDNADLNDENKGPIINLSKEPPYFIGRNEVFNLSAEGSIDPDGNSSVDYLWEISKKNEESILISSDKGELVARYPSVGNFDIKLTVTDEEDEERVLTLPITVQWSAWDKYAFLVGVLILLLIILYLVFRKKLEKKSKKKFKK